MATDLILATAPLGMGVAASHRIGNMLGAVDCNSVVMASRAPHILAVILGLVECAGINSVRNIYGNVFSDDQIVVALTAHVLPLMAAFQILDLANG